jgi:hypothetical protein
MGRSWLAVVLISGLVAGCASREQIAQRELAAEKALQAHNEARCSSFGYQPGTPDYTHCLQAMDMQEQQRLTAMQMQQAAAAANMGDSLQQAGAALQSINPPQPMPAPVISRPTQCNFIGNTMTCF